MNLPVHRSVGWLVGWCVLISNKGGKLQGGGGLRGLIVTPFTSIFRELLHVELELLLERLRLFRQRLDLLSQVKILS